MLLKPLRTGRILVAKVTVNRDLLTWIARCSGLASPLLIPVAVADKKPSTIRVEIQRMSAKSVRNLTQSLTVPKVCDTPRSISHLDNVENDAACTIGT